MLYPQKQSCQVWEEQGQKSVETGTACISIAAQGISPCGELDAVYGIQVIAFSVASISQVGGSTIAARVSPQGCNSQVEQFGLKIAEKATALVCFA